MTQPTSFPSFSNNPYQTSSNPFQTPPVQHVFNTIIGRNTRGWTTDLNAASEKDKIIIFNAISHRIINATKIEEEIVLREQIISQPDDANLKGVLYTNLIHLSLSQNNIAIAAKDAEYALKVPVTHPDVKYYLLYLCSLVFARIDLLKAADFARQALSIPFSINDPFYQALVEQVVGLSFTGGIWTRSV